jgi:hypothetical protein
MLLNIRNKTRLLIENKKILILAKVERFILSFSAGNAPPWIRDEAAYFLVVRGF